MKKNILIINGPNLNLLGTREPEIYGRERLKDINTKISNYGKTINIRTVFFQSNHEGKIIDKIHTLLNRRFQGLIINPGALTHYSYAIRDAIKAVNIITVEVHISDIGNRESFRNSSVIQEVCYRQISGHGVNGYIMALDIFKSVDR